MKSSRVLIVFTFCLAIFLSFNVALGEIGYPSESVARSKLPDQLGTIDPQTTFLPESEIKFEQIVVADGLSRGNVNAIYQDHFGFMWFGTNGGLNKYDGYQFTVYKNNPNESGSLSDDNVLSIYEDRLGELWVGTSSGLNRLDRATGSFSHYKHDPDNPLSLGPGNIKVLYEDSSGTLWVGTSSGLYQFDRTNNSFSLHLENYDIQALYEDRFSNLWVGTNWALWRLNKDRGLDQYYLNVRGADSISSSSITSIYEDSLENLWIGTSDGLNRFDRTEDSFVSYYYDSDDPCSLSNNTVTAIHEDDQGRLWVGSLNGLNIYDPGPGCFYHLYSDPADPQSLASDLVITMYEDRSGVLWVGTYSGISKVNRISNRFKRYTKGQNLSSEGEFAPDEREINLSDSLVLGIYEDQDGILWVGTIMGGLNRLDRDSGTVRVYQSDPEDPASIANNQVRGVYRDQQGVLWVATAGGLDWFNPETETFSHHLQFRNIYIEVISEDRQGNLWIGTENGLYRRAPGEDDFSQQPLFQLPNQLSNLIASIYEDKVGGLWVGLLHGAVYLEHPETGKYIYYTNDPEDDKTISYGIVISFWEDRFGAVWMAVVGGGLDRFDKYTQTFTHYTQEAGLPETDARCILADEDGYLWVSTSKGISRFDPVTGKFHNYDFQDGAQAGEFIRCFQNNRGEMFFGGEQGLNVFSPDQIIDNLIPPPLVITSIKLNNRTWLTDPLADEHLNLTYKENNLSFEFAALDYTAPAKNQYAYQMEGLDSSWVEAGTRRHADYPDLKPGSYVFRVRGSNNDGVWSEEGAAVMITITPPFWQTKWFIGLMVLVALVAVFGGYRLRVNQIEARSRELERLVEERTLETEQRRRELEALYRADEELYRHIRLDEVLHDLVHAAVEILQADKGTLMVWDQQHQNLTVRASHGFKTETVQKMSFSPGQGVAGVVGITGESVIIEDVNLDPRVTRFIIEAEGIQALIQTPIKINNDIFGVFSADYLQPHRFSEDEKRLLTALAQRAGLAIEKARLHEQEQELAVVQERNRLARDLHDSVTQTLFATTLYADAAEISLSNGQAEQSAENLRDLRTSAKQALGEMRLLIYELRPQILEAEGLVSALETRLETVENRSGIKSNFVVEGEINLPADVEAHIFHIAVEALNNTLKHAQASQISLTLRQSPDQIYLEVTDNGVGFEPDAAISGGGLGLDGMIERARQVGGETFFRSKPGQGASVIFQLELKNEL